VFDQYNIRYLSGTVIGEWARDKLTRWCLLTGNGEPWVWDFGSAARHHKLYAPWIPAQQSLAGLVGLRGAVSPKAGLFKKAAQEIRDILKAEGVGDLPLGIDVVEPPFLFALQELGLEVRDGQQVLLEARMLKSQDELTLLNMAAAMVDGVYQDIFEALKPGVRENEIVALANQRLYQMGADNVEAINAISGERCSPHPHNFTASSVPATRRSSTSSCRSSATGPATTGRSAWARPLARSSPPTRRRASGWTRPLR
jgi:Xaa-Pro dipeptidase